MTPEADPATLLPAIVEALLFVAEQPLSVEAIQVALESDAVSEAAVLAALDELEQRYEADVGARGFRLVRLAETWQFRTTPQVGPWLKVFTGLTPVRLSRAALETLAIVAYRQPCTRSDVERVRGVDTGGVMRALLDRRLIRVTGRRDEPGRPNVYATSPEFLRVFGLGSLADLPSLREFTMLGEEDLEMAADLLGDPELRNQVTFEEYAARRVLEGVDAEVDRRTVGPSASEEPV
jgi:segregation and condensation protein B